MKTLEGVACGEGQCVQKPEAAPEHAQAFGAVRCRAMQPGTAHPLTKTASGFMPNITLKGKRAEEVHLDLQLVQLLLPLLPYPPC